MSEAIERAQDEGNSGRIARLEARIARLEERLAAGDGIPGAQPGRSVERSATVPMPEGPPDTGGSADAFEFEVGQNWFAKAGIIALAAGATFALSLPFDDLPAGVPSLAGYSAALILFLIAHFWRGSFDLVSRYSRGAGMALLYFATLRMYFFGSSPLLRVDSAAGAAVLSLIVAVNLGIAHRRQSPYLFSLALGTGYVTAVAVGSPGFVWIAVAVLSVITIHARIKYAWPGVLLLGIALTHLAYFTWAAGNPVLSHQIHLLDEPRSGIFILLVCTAILALGSILRPDRELEDPGTIVSGLLNCGLGYGVFLVHSLAFGAGFAAAHLTASLVFLALAVTFWMRERSRASTFLYAMTGYMALSMAIIKATAAPDVFVWLSLQSVVVAATAVWFRSRFIVVANFVIYLAIVLAYVILAERETGISLGIGIVALGSARILNWQKERLELKTELMRNAYLLSAFAIFPYALYHLVPGGYVGLAWVGVALFYYLLNLVVRNRKYRWLGHATLLLTALYLLIIGTSRFEPRYRILSFFVLGTVLLVVSLVFTKLRNRANTGTAVSPRP